jgi:methylamine dehydrogenase accessory protein MauD
VSDALLVSNLLLWVAVVVLAAVVFALVRQIGVLHERVAPTGALMLGGGPKVGEAAPELMLRDLAGREQRVGGRQAEGHSTLLFFLSPTCPVCESLLPTLRSVARSESAWLDVLLASDGPRHEHEAFVRDRELERFPYLVSTELGLAFAVGRLPFAVLIDEAGVIRAKGLVNTREHLESLFEAKEAGVESVQEFVQRAHSDEARREAGARPNEREGAA